MMSTRGKLLFVTGLTLIRFPLVLVFFCGAILHSVRPHPALFLGSLIALAASAITDLFDGYYARKFKVVTAFGAHADPLMDKLFYLTALPVTVYLAAVNGNHGHAVVLLFLTMFLLSRDQWVTFLRSIGAMYNVSGAAHWAGKVRTFLNFPLICCIYIFEAAPEPWAVIPPLFIYTFEIVGALINLISLHVYTRHYLPYLRRSMTPESS